VDGQVVHTRIPRERPPVQDYLRRQGRFSHLFQAGQEPSLVDDIQQRVDDYWKEVV
jgi:pyruvate ferredoxin oxidoreductase beta subunit